MYRVDGASVSYLRRPSSRRRRRGARYLAALCAVASSSAVAHGAAYERAFVETNADDSNDLRPAATRRNVLLAEIL